MPACPSFVRIPSYLPPIPSHPSDRAGPRVSPNILETAPPRPTARGLGGAQRFVFPARRIVAFAPLRLYNAAARGTGPRPLDCSIRILQSATEKCAASGSSVLLHRLQMCCDDDSGGIACGLASGRTLKFKRYVVDYSVSRPRMVKPAGAGRRGEAVVPPDVLHRRPGGVPARADGVKAIGRTPSPN
jgi:hypothetical protein